MTTTERGPSWSERLNPRNWSLTVKLLIVGLVPTLLALGLGALRIADQADVAAELGRSNTLLAIRDQVATTADSLRVERDAAVRFAAGKRAGDRAAVQSTFAATDVEVGKYRQAVIAGTTKDPATAASSVQTSSALDSLPTLRNDALGSAIGADEILDRYGAVIAQADVLGRALLREVSRPEIAGLVDAQTAVTSASEQLALQHTVLAAAIAAGELRQIDRNTVAGADAAYNAAFGSYQLALTGEQQRRFGSFVLDPSNDTRAQLEAQILAAPDGRPIPVDPAAWDAAYTAALDALNTSGGAVNTQLKSDNTAAQEAASNEAGVNSVILMLGLLLGIVIIVLLARSLLKSLRVLRSSALDIAERQLPNAVESLRSGESPNANVEPVPVDSRDEVGQVARAFDAVHGQAVRLAADQAALQANVNSMFVNLSRRSQALVERQLQLIEQLESNEQDADQLSNLFQLDHLATRMRRNSENLLVLAGTELSKRNIAPVPVVDVLRAAVSEVEQYQRIVVQTPPSVNVVGRAANDLVHLLAELLDNATNFSPPDSQVVLSSTRTDDGSVLVEIADRGVGMAEHELADANQRLSGPAQVDVSASRRMGLFVVGRLAARHGIGVRLGTSTGGGPGGLTASVTVPGHLVPESTVRPEGPATGVGMIPPQLPQQVQPEPVNGHPRSGGLADLVAGDDGPMLPAETFGTSPSAPATQVNGSGPLPTRRPGVNLRPDGRRVGRDGPEVAPAPSTGTVGAAPGGAIAGAGPADAGSAIAGPPPPELGSALAGPAPRTSADTEPAAAGREPRSGEGAASGSAAGRATGPGSAAAEAPADQAPPREAASAPADSSADGTGANGTEAADPVDDAGADTAQAEGAGAPDPAAGVEAGAGAAGAAANGVARSSDAPGAEARGGGGAAPAAEPPAGPAAGSAADAGPGEPTGATEVGAAGGRSEPATSAPTGQGDQPTTDTAPADRPGAEGAPTGAVPAAADNHDGPPAGPSVSERVTDAVPPTSRLRTIRPLGSLARSTPPAPERAASQGPPPSGSERAPAPPAGAAPTGTQPAAPQQAGQQPAPQPSPQSGGRQPVGPQAAAQPGQQPAGPQPAQQAGPPAADPQEQQPGPARGLPPAAQAGGPPPVAGAQHDQQAAAAAGRPAVPAGPPAPARPLTRPTPTEPSNGTSREPAGIDESSGFSTPIFAEIASAWFRSNRPIPVNWAEEVPQNGAPNVPADNPLGAGAPVAGPPMAGGLQPRPVAPANGQSGAARPDGTPPRNTAAMPPAQPAAPVARRRDEFASVADEGWQAAETVTSDGEEFTAAGLPKRRPRARLVPGSAAGSAVLAPSAPAPTAGGRTADAVRGRLASYQQGIRQGRENRLRRERDVAGPRAAGTTDDRPAGAGEQDEETR